MDEAAWLIQKRAQTRSAYSHARLPIKIEAFFSFSFFLLLPKRRPVNAPHSFPVSSHQVRALDFHFAPLYPFADTILFLSSNFGHIRSTRPCFCHHRASKTRQRERGTESIKAVGTAAFLPLPPAKGKQSLHIAFLHIFHSDRRWGDCPFVPPLDARFFRFEQAACRATAMRLRRRGYAYRGEWINNNGRRRYTGVLSAGRWRMHPGHNP